MVILNYGLCFEKSSLFLGVEMLNIVLFIYFCIGFFFSCCYVLCKKFGCVI